MPSTHETIVSLADEITNALKSSRCILIYAANTTGKTRLAQHLKDQDPDGVTIYNSFVEDAFIWNNERVVLTMNTSTELLDTIETQGLDVAITDNFQAFTGGRIEPTIDFARSEVRFGVHGGDNRSRDTVKISRAEESIFIWSVFYSVLEEAISTLSDDVESRTTATYDTLGLAVVDDPVSSMDDVRIVSVALALSELIKRASKTNLKFVVLTHHALFFNVIFNSLRRDKHTAHVLTKESGGEWTLTKQSKDAPFSYHLGLIENIREAISANTLERSHFNQFRTLLEKTASFLGHTGGWGSLLTGPDSALLTKILNLYSHDRFAEIEYAGVSKEYSDAFTNEFQRFLHTYGWAASA